MFAVVVREAGDAAQIDGSGGMVSANVAPRVREAPGFVSALWMSDGAGRTLNVLVFSPRRPRVPPSRPPAPRHDPRSCASSLSTCSACWRARRRSTSSRRLVACGTSGRCTGRPPQRVGGGLLGRGGGASHWRPVFRFRAAHSSRPSLGFVEAVVARPLFGAPFSFRARRANARARPRVGCAGRSVGAPPARGSAALVAARSTLS